MERIVSESKYLMCLFEICLLLFEICLLLFAKLAYQVMLTIRGRLITPFCSGVHVCWSEHSDSSFVYGFMILDYGFGTMTATISYIYKDTFANVANTNSAFSLACTSKVYCKLMRITTRINILHMIFLH